MSVYGLQLTMRGMQPFFPPCPSFINVFEPLYGLSRTATVEMGQRGFFVVLLSAADLLCQVALAYTATDNTADKATSPACELPLCVQLW